MRYTFVKTLRNLARKNKKIYLLTGDLGYTVFEEFREEFPDRFINVGVAEQNLMSIASGLAMTDKVVFAYSIATFATMRPFEQIRNDIAAHNSSVVIVGTGAGLSYADASITHHAIEDISLMRTIPTMTVLCPADPIETEWATRESASRKSPVYLRLGKKGEPILYEKRPILTIGKGSLLIKGSSIAILAIGNIVHNALQAAILLAKRNIRASVYSIHTVKPIDRKLIEQLCKTYKLLVTVEEHSVIGGLGSTVAEIVSEQPSRNLHHLKIAIPDTFIFTIGSQKYLREKIGLSPEKIAKSIYKNLTTNTTFKR